MWTVIYIAPTQSKAEKMEQKLSDEGFMVKIRPSSLSKYQYEILVPEGELADMEEMIHSILNS